MNQYAVVWCESATLKIHFQDDAITSYCTQWLCHSEQTILLRCLFLKENQYRFKSVRCLRSVKHTNNCCYPLFVHIGLMSCSDRGNELFR